MLPITLAGRYLLGQVGMKGLELLVFERSAAGIGDPDVGHASKCPLIGDAPCILSGTSACRDPPAIAGAAGNPERWRLHDAKHIGARARRASGRLPYSN